MLPHRALRLPVQDARRHGRVEQVQLDLLTICGRVSLTSTHFLLFMFLCLATMSDSVLLPPGTRVFQVFSGPARR
jgi:hypothetical protein